MTGHDTYYRTLQCYSDTKVGGIEVRHLTINVAPNWRVEVELWIDDLRHRVPQLAGPFDAIFHDPFSPQKMPELWTFDLFSEYFRLLQTRQGRLLTYSAAAAVRGGLQEAGFNLAVSPGLGNKGGGTVAWVPSEPAQQDGLCSVQSGAQLAGSECRFSPLEAWEMEYLHSKAGIPYRDPGLSQTREEILSIRDAEQSTSLRPSGSSALKRKPRYQPKTN